MGTWVEDIEQALKNLGGQATLYQIYEEVKRIRKEPLPDTWKASIRERIESNSSDSHNFKGRDIFRKVGKGTWALREQNAGNVISEEISLVSPSSPGPDITHRQQKEDVAQSAPVVAQQIKREVKDSKSQEFIIDNGLFPNEVLNFSLSESFDTVANLFRTIKEYRDYVHPESISWEEYILEFFHILGFNTTKVAPRLITIDILGERSSPKALVGVVNQSESLSSIIPGIDWASYLFFASKHFQIKWGILTNGCDFKIFNFSNNHIEDATFLFNLEGIIQNERLDSFFSTYKVFAHIKGRKIEEIKKVTKISTPVRKNKNFSSGEYDLEHHAQGKLSSTVQLFQALRTRIFSLSNAISETYNKKSIDFSEEKNFCSVHLLRDHLKLWVNADIEKLTDPFSICRDVRNIGHYGTGNTELYIYNDADIENVFAIIVQSYHLRADKETPEHRVGLGKTHLLRQKFWTQLLEMAKNRTRLHRNVSPGPEHWLGSGSGKRGLSYNYVVHKSDAFVEIYIDRGDYEWNKSAFNILLQQKEEIERALGSELEWNFLEKKRACRIKYFLPKCDLEDITRWPELQNQLIEAMICLDKAFQPYYDKLPK